MARGLIHFGVEEPLPNVSTIFLKLVDDPLLVVNELYTSTMENLGGAVVFNVHKVVANKLVCLRIIPVFGYAL